MSRRRREGDQPGGPSKPPRKHLGDRFRGSFPQKHGVQPQEAYRTARHFEQTPQFDFYNDRDITEFLNVFMPYTIETNNQITEVNRQIRQFRNQVFDRYGRLRQNTRRSMDTFNWMNQVIDGLNAMQTTFANRSNEFQQLLLRTEDYVERLDENNPLNRRLRLAVRNIEVINNNINGARNSVLSDMNRLLTRIERVRNRLAQSRAQRQGLPAQRYDYPESPDYRTPLLRRGTPPVSPDYRTPVLPRGTPPVSGSRRRNLMLSGTPRAQLAPTTVGPYRPTGTVLEDLRRRLDWSDEDDTVEIPSSVQASRRSRTPTPRLVRSRASDSSLLGAPRAPPGLRRLDRALVARRRLDFGEEAGQPLPLSPASPQPLTQAGRRDFFPTPDSIASSGRGASQAMPPPSAARQMPRRRLDFDSPITPGSPAIPPRSGAMLSPALRGMPPPAARGMPPPAAVRQMDRRQMPRRRLDFGSPTTPRSPMMTPRSSPRVPSGALARRTPMRGALGTPLSSGRRGMSPLAAAPVGPQRRVPPRRGQLGRRRLDFSSSPRTPGAQTAPATPQGPLAPIDQPGPSHLQPGAYRPPEDIIRAMTQQLKFSDSDSD